MPGPTPRTLWVTACPDLLDELVGPTANRPDVDPHSLGSGSNLPLRWRCATCAQEWEATPAARCKGGACPACARGVRARSRAQAPPGRSLADLYPHLATQFVSNLDRPEMGPVDLRCASKQRCVWACGTCSHQWEATVANRVKNGTGTGCPACANAVRGTHRSTPTPASGTAAEAAPHLLAEFVTNLTRPGVGLAAVKPASTDRCTWVCVGCACRWEATVVNRVKKRSGCPACGVGRNALIRATAPTGAALATLHPLLAAEYVANLTRPGHGPDRIRPGSNAVCRWRCVRGHEWETTVVARVGGTGCARCSGRGQSRLEFEVAALLRVATGTTVTLDEPVRAAGRTWRIDLYLPVIELLVDLDPARWHTDYARDQRKTDALTSALDTTPGGRRYLRVRPASLPAVTGRTATVIDDTLDAWTWATALRPLVTVAGLRWTSPDMEARGRALTAAAERWQETMRGRPVRSAVDAAPHLRDELVANLIRPGTDLAWLPPSSRDTCRWRCGACGHEWDSSVASRAGTGSGCPACARAATTARSKARARPEPGESLADRYPALAAELVGCLSEPDRTAADLRPSSNLTCRWRCGTCSHEWTTTPASRVRGTGCPRCARVRGGTSRSSVPLEASLATTNPQLVAELVDFPGRLDRVATNVAPGSNLAAQWRCRVCDHTWTTTVAARALAGTGCPTCGRARTAAARSAPNPDASLAWLFPAVAAELVANLTHPGRAAEEMRAGSHDRCRWRCAVCGGQWEAVAKNRTRNGTGCPLCHRARRSAGAF